MPRREPSRYTAEGQVEDAGRFARSVKRGSPTVRRQARVMGWALVLIPVGILAIAAVAVIVTR